MKLVLLIVFSIVIQLVENKYIVKLRDEISSHEESSQAIKGKVEDVVESDPGSVFSGWLKVLQVPKVYFDSAPVSFKALCNVSEGRLGVDIAVTKENDIEVKVFRKTIKCSLSNSISKHTIRLKLPRYLAYKPGPSNRYSVYIENATLKIWLMSKKDYIRLKGKRQVEDYINGKGNQTSNSKNANVFVESLKILKPFERPERPSTACQNWLSETKNKWKELTFRPTCSYEEEISKAIKFPVALSGFNTGVHRAYQPFQSAFLKRKHLEKITRPEFSFVMWLYLHDHCSRDRCSILQHITWDDNYATPRVEVNQKGELSVELVMEDGSSLVDQCNKVLPKKQWIRLLLSCLPTQCNVTVGYGDSFNTGWTRIISIQGDSPFYFNDTVGLFVYGGSELGASFQGYIGQAIFYRMRAINIDQVPAIRENDVMLRLQLTQREARCERYNNHLDYLTRIFNKKHFKRLEKTTCMALTNPFLQQHLTSDLLECPAVVFHRTKHYGIAYSLLKKHARSGLRLNKFDLSDYLYEEAEFILLVYLTTKQKKKGAKKTNQTISLLKQSSCLGNHDATFMLAVLLNYGLTIPFQEIQAHSYLMDGGLEGNRLCLLSLGNKHVHGLDGFPVDYEQAYVYFKAVADMTNRDLEVHNRNDVYTEMVRLTNHYEVDEQTEEDGEVVTYLRLRASQGDFGAIQTMARMYYWGSGGLERDVVRAVEYYRMAAQLNEPSALYDYGIILLKGHGVKKNVTEAVNVLTKSADLGYPQALNTLGWYYMDNVGNFSEAALLFHKSHELGNKDAAYNIAYMFLHGIYPDSPVDKVKAWDYLAAGALRGQFDASILIGMYNLRGHPRIIRNLELAIGWMRHVAEQNPGIGRLLFKGLKAYKKHNWFPTLVYYLMAASTGVEVANFNLAYICEEDHGGYVKYLEKECVWRHYNLSIQRASKDVDPYAWNKMAHYYYYHGIGGRNDTQTAIELYAAAALSGDPQGLYNLAMLSNDGIRLNEYILSKLSVPLAIQKDNVLLSFHLLTRCQDSYKQESYLPCTFGLFRVAFTYYWRLISLHYKRVFSFCVVAVICVASLNIIHQRQTRPYNIQY